MAGRPINPRRVRWQDLHLWQIQPVRDILLVVGILLLIRLGYEISIVTVPLLLGLLLAYLFEPLVALLVKRDRMRRQVAAGGIIAVVAVAVLVPLTAASVVAVTQVLSLAENVAKNSAQVSRSVEDFASREKFEEIEDDSWRGIRNVVVQLSVPPDQIQQAREAFLDAHRMGTPDPAEPELVAEPEAQHSQPNTSEQAAEAEAESTYEPDPSMSESDLLAHLPDGKLYSPQLGAIVSSGLVALKERAGLVAGAAVESGGAVIEAVFAGVASVGGIVFMGFLTAMFFFFISTSYARVINFARELVPDSQRQRVFDLIGKMDRVVSAFVRGRITIAVILGVFFTLGYWLIGAPAPFLLGPVVGVLSIAPYISLLGLPITIGAMFVDPQPLLGAWQAEVWWILLGPFLVYQIGQIIDDYLLTPSIQGKAVGMDTPTILFAVLAGGALAGIYGVLIAIPVAACVKILLREVFWPNFKAWTHGEAPDFLPIGRGKSHD